MAIFDPPDGSIDTRPRCVGHCCRGFSLEYPYSRVQAAVDTMTTRRHRVAVRGTRGIGPATLVHNARLGTVDVDAATGMVSFDGERVYVDPVDRVPLSRLYFL